MLRQAAQGARWYQHVARRSPLIPSLPLPRTVPVVTRRSVHYGGPDDKVRFYEQDTPGSKTRRKVNPEAEESVERGEVEEKLSRVQQELRVLEEGPFGPNSEFMRSLPEKDRAIALEALRKHAVQRGQQDTDGGLDQVFDEELDEILREEFEGFAEEEENWQVHREDGEDEKPVVTKPYEVVLPDEESHSYVDRFNERLDQFTHNKSNEPLKQELWKWYRRCKQVVPGFLEAVPEEARSLVWDSQISGQIAKDARAAHLQTLAEDAAITGRNLSTPHTISYIQSLHEGGKTNQALDQWEAYQNELSQRKEDLEAYWKLGVRLFAAEDNPQRAQDIALAFLANDQTRQPRILNPVIVAWGRQPGEEAGIKAWALYLQLKIFLGPDMTMEDYDHISIGLLKAGRFDLAIAVFKDMMVTGKDPADDSTALYKSAVGFAGNLHASSISERQVNRVSLSTLTLIPRRFQNRFFYASWMKKLIGMGEVDSAASVIELMYERGVKPDSKHLNGLMAAWLREGSPSARTKAESLAWAMIQQRIDLVWDREKIPGQAPRLSLNQQADPRVRIPKWMQRTVPPGNIETFSILLLYYTRKGDDDMTDYLIKRLADARIKPNSYFMNHLLYAELRRQDLRTLWHKFRTMSATTQPDLETYACLWDCGKLQYDRGRTAFETNFPTARQLFAEMVTWYTNLSPRAKSATQDGFSKDLYDQIIRCFCLSKDLPGTLVALHTLRTTFNVYPDDTTARLIILQVSRLASVPADTPKRRLRRLSSTPRSRENIHQVQRLVDILSQRKAAALEEKGLSLSNMDPHERNECQLEIMAYLLRIVMGRMGDPSEVEGRVLSVAGEMGASDVDLGTPLGEESRSLL